MLSDEEKKELKELINLMYNNHISQYGKRKLEKYIKKQSKEIEELKENNKNLEDELNKYIVKMSDEQYRRLVDIIRDEINKLWKDKIKAKIEESELLIDNSQGCMSDEDLYKEYGKIEFGQSLLEKG